MWNPGWDEIFKKHEWGTYPPEEVVRFVARNYYRHLERARVNILEIGSGTGANLFYLAREGFQAHGLDGSRIALEQAKSRLNKEKLSVPLCQAEAGKIPFADESFDCVLDIECIYANNLVDSKQIIQEIHRVLKPGGTLFSKTFMTGTYGDGNGTLLAGEPHTYVEISEGVFHKGYGIIRLTAEEQIPELYGIFNSIEYDYAIRSDNNRKFEVKEWVIHCTK